MFAEGTKLIVSGGEWRAEEIPIELIHKAIEKDDLFTITYNVGTNRYEYVAIKNVELAETPENCIKMSAVSHTGTIRDVLCKSSHKVCTHNRGMVPAYAVSDADILIDIEDKKCKISEKTNVSAGVPFYNVVLTYSDNTFANGILMKCKPEHHSKNDDVL